MKPHILLLILALSTTASAQTQHALTLQDAIVMAQHQGPAAEVARSTRDNARYTDQAFNARLRPQLVLTGDAANLNHGISPVVFEDGSTQFVGQSQNQSSLQLGFRQAIPFTGATIGIGTQVSRIDEFANQATPYSRLYSTTPVVLTIQQGLFQPRTIVWQERLQSLNVSVAERGYLEAREDVAASVASAFFDLYAAQMTLANASGNVAINDTLYTLNKGRFEVGKIGENDLLQSELQLLRARASADDAKLQRDRAEAALRRQIGYPEGQPLDIVTPDSIPNVEADADVAVREALRNSSAIEQNAYDEVFAKQQTNAAKLGNRFNATVAASIGFNQTGSAIGPAYQSPLGKQSLEVALNMPVIQWGAGSADMQAAKAGEDRVAANNKIRRDALVEDARFSALALQQAQRNVLISAKADTVAEKGFTVAKERYLIGKIANLDLYNAQTQKDDAVLAYVAALRNYWTAYYHLRRVTLYDFAQKREMADEPSR